MEQNTVEEMADAMRPLAVTPEPPTNVRVKVFRDEDGVIKIECSRPVPDLKRVAVHLAKAHHAKVKKCLDWGRGVLQSISKHDGAISFQEWANAIGEAIIQADADAGGGTFETNALREPAYLALGDTLFRLSPVEALATNKALAATKKRASEKAEIQVKNKLAEAQLAADALIQSANRLKEQAQETLRQAQRQKPAPAWAVGGMIACKYLNNYSQQWAVEIVIKFKIEHFDQPFMDADGNLKTYRWEAKPANPVNTRIWVPISQDGSYAISAVFIDAHCNQIPHISHFNACLSPGDAPRRVASTYDLEALRDSIQRCMNGVQINSLLTDPSEWLPTFKDSVPADLYKVLKDRDYKINAERLAKSLDAATPVSVENEEATTWTA